ncbi:hypothetical protein EMMF5_005057 [Cystobasidiomycetes sp. EMM_F5]
MVNTVTPTTTSTSELATSSSDSASTASNGPATTTSTSAAPFPTEWASVIVPANTATTIPKGYTLISILFGPALSWSWLLSNSDASAQAFAFMPSLIADTLNISSSNVYTDSLQAYTPSSTAKSSDILAVYLAYIPSSDVDALSVNIKTPNSAFYTSSNGVAKELAQVVNPTFSVTSYAAQGVSSNIVSTPGTGGSLAISGSTTATDNGNNNTRSIIIGVVTGFGVAMLVALAYYAIRRARKTSKGSGRGAAQRRPSTSSHMTAASGRSGVRQLRLSRQSEMSQVSRDPMRSIYAPGQSPVYAFPGGRSNPNNNTYNHEYTRPMSEASFSSNSDDTHGSSGSSRSGAEDQWHRGHGSGHSSSIDFATINAGDVRNSWWRFSDGFGRALTSPHSVGSTSPISSRRNTNRRINIQRGPLGDIAGISRPQMQENSLLL